jgi:predicted HicB family RNase H-like nuclease
MKRPNIRIEDETYWLAMAVAARLKISLNELIIKCLHKEIGITGAKQARP